jgi:hypothetical protein
MARFQLAFIIDYDAFKSAVEKEFDFETVHVEPYTEDSNCVSVTVRAESLHTFVEIMSEDEDLEDWSDIILDADIVND